MLAGSKRGGRASHQSKPKSQNAAVIGRQQANGRNEPSQTNQRQTDDPSTIGQLNEETDDELSAELRNPSDALQILVQSDIAANDDSRTRNELRSGHFQEPQATQILDANSNAPNEPRGERCLAIDEYELVRSGLLPVGTVLELLLM